MLSNARFCRGICAGVLSFFVAAPAHADIDGYVARLTNTGQMDALNFGLGGGIIPNIPGDNWIEDVRRDTQGRYVVCGNYVQGTTRRILVSRYSTNGSLDAGFGWAGAASATWPVNLHTAGCAIDANGRIVVAATEGPSSSANGFVLVRFTALGQLDASFGIGGFSYVTSSTQDTQASDVQIHASTGHIYVLGSRTQSGFSFSDFAVFRFTDTGILDPNFSGDGIQITHISDFDFGSALAVDTSGRPVVIGSTFSGPNEVISILRYTTSGDLDNAFSGDGKQSLAIPQVDVVARNIAIDTSGRIVVVGHTTTPGNNPSDLTQSHHDIALIRLNSVGAFDSTFGLGGLVLRNSTQFDFADDVQIADGKIVVTGSTGTSYFQGFLTAFRFNDNGSPDSNFDGDGVAKTNLGGSTVIGKLVMDGTKPVLAGTIYPINP